MARTQSACPFGTGLLIYRFQALRARLRSASPSGTQTSFFQHSARARLPSFSAFLRSRPGYGGQAGTGNRKPSLLTASDFAALTPYSSFG